MKTIYFSLLLFLPALVLAKDIRIEAKKEFEKCLRETKKEREQCNFGGCGNIIGACYDRQLNVISLATISLKKSIESGRCKQAGISAAGDIENLDSKLKQLAPFDNTWGGYEVQVEVALLKNNVMNSLKNECEAKN